MTEWIEYGQRLREEQEKNPHPGIIRLRRLVQEYGGNIDLLIAEQRPEYHVE